MDGEFRTAPVRPRILARCAHNALQDEQVRIYLLDHVDVACVATAHADLSEGDLVVMEWEEK